MVKCACNHQDCKIEIKVQAVDGEIHLWITDKDGNESLMYLDPNRVVELIHELRSALLSIT